MDRCVCGCPSGVHLAKAPHRCAGCRRCRAFERDEESRRLAELRRAPGRRVRNLGLAVLVAVAIVVATAVL